MSQTFHGFEIREKIGSGGMSTVYRGVHQTLGYPVAIKVLHPALAGDENFIARFEREAHSASSLRSNNIATVIDFGTENDIYFIVMEFVDGPDLSQLLAKMQGPDEKPRGLPAEIALILLDEIAYGLQEAHHQSIIHRDVKPSNILLNKKGEVKIADFGLARDTSKVSPLGGKDLTMPGMVVGTPSYMSPEQAVGKENIDHCTDIFSLGVMAYQLLSGRKPFVGTTPAEVQENIINQPPPPLEYSECPLRTAEIDQIMAKLLAKDPARRFQSMDQVRRGIQTAIDSIDIAGNVGRYRREYLKRFVADPRVFSEELRQQNIADRLKRGYHFKEMGLSSIGEAVQEFYVVLALDPKNNKAAAALTELQRKAEESGVAFPAFGRAASADDADVTRIVSAGAMGRSPAPDTTRVVDGQAPTPSPAAPFSFGSATDTMRIAWSQLMGLAAQFLARGRELLAPAGDARPLRRRPLLLTGAAGLIVVVALLIVLPGRKDETGIVRVDPDPPVSPDMIEPASAAAPDTTETQEAVAVAEVDSGVAFIDPEPDPEPEVVMAATGRLNLTSDPDGVQIWLRRPSQGDFVRQGNTPWTGEVETGRWELRFEQPGHEGRTHFVEIAEGETSSLQTSLQPRARGPAWVRLTVTPYADIYINGELRHAGTNHAVAQLPSGRRHQIEYRRDDLFGRHSFEIMPIAPGETLLADHHRFELASLSVRAAPSARMILNGRQVDGQTPLTIDHIVAGLHRVTVIRPGFSIRDAWLVTNEGRQPLTRLPDEQGRPMFRLDLKQGQAARLEFELSPES